MAIIADLVEFVHRIIQDPKYADKLYHAFEMQMDSDSNRKFQKQTRALFCFLMFPAFGSDCIANYDHYFK